MWFNNALIYHYELKNSDNSFAEALKDDYLKPCPPHARSISGWVSVLGDELTQEIAGAILLCLGKEERILPRGVINRQLAERVHELERQQGRTIKRSEKAQMAEDLEFELLPKSFCVQKKLLALLDTTRKRLIINTASENQAAQFTAFLRKSIVGIQLEPLHCPDNMPLLFTQWIHEPALLPSGFQLASDCLLFAPDDDKKKVNCKGYELPASEITTLLSQGLAAAEISLVWNERIQFTLTQDLTFKRIKSLDYLVDQFEEIKQLEEDFQQQDAALMLLSGELRQMIDDLMNELTTTKPVVDDSLLTEITVNEPVIV